MSGCHDPKLGKIEFNYAPVKQKTDAEYLHDMIKALELRIQNIEAMVGVVLSKI